MNTILTCYLIQRQDPQRRKFWQRDDDAVVRMWIESLTRLGLHGVIIHDGLSPEFQQRWTNPCVSFHEIVWRLPWTAAEERVLAYRDWLIHTQDCQTALATDLADVEFYRDPFALMTDSDAIYVGSEPELISGSIVERWMRDSYGEVTDLDKPILNPGICGGNRDALLPFLGNWLEEMWRAVQPTPPPHDLAAFNRLIYREHVRIVTGYPLHTRFRANEGPEGGAAIRHK